MTSEHKGLMKSIINTKHCPCLHDLHPTVSTSQYFLPRIFTGARRQRGGEVWRRWRQKRGRILEEDAAQQKMDSKKWNVTPLKYLADMPSLSSKKRDKIYFFQEGTMANNTYLTSSPRAVILQGWEVFVREKSISGENFQFNSLAILHVQEYF